MTAEPPPGLCGDCRHARALTTGSGGTIYQCLKAQTDARLDKWPRLPMLSCPAHEPGEAERLA